jgi:hypothetical protein
MPCMEHGANDRSLTSLACFVDVISLVVDQGANSAMSAALTDPGRTHSPNARRDEAMLANVR